MYKNNKCIPDSHLCTEEPLALEVELGVFVSGAVSPDPGLHRPHQLVDLVVADLLHQTKDTSPKRVNKICRLN